MWKCQANMNLVEMLSHMYDKQCTRAYYSCGKKSEHVVRRILYIFAGLVYAGILTTRQLILVVKWVARESAKTTPEEGCCCNAIATDVHSKRLKRYLGTRANLRALDDVAIGCIIIQSYLVVFKVLRNCRGREEFTIWTNNFFSIAFLNYIASGNVYTYFYE